MKGSIVFSRLMDDYGSLEEAEKGSKKEGAVANSPEELGNKKVDATLMQAEERNTGSVTWQVYAKYLHFAGGIIWAPVILLLLTLTQGAQGKIYQLVVISQGNDNIILVGNNLFLGFWTARSIPGFRQGDYMAVYAVLGEGHGHFPHSDVHCIIQVPLKQFSRSFSAFHLRTSRCHCYHTQILLMCPLFEDLQA